MNIKPINVSSIEDLQDGTYKVEYKLIEPIYVYVLFYNKLPVYVGQTNNIKKRIKLHNKLDKIKFDEYYLIAHYYKRSLANIGERAVISAMKVINKELLNKNNAGYRLYFTNNIKIR